MRRFFLQVVFLYVWASGEWPASAQGVVEYAVSTASRAAGTGVNKIGDALVQIFENTSDTLKNADRGWTRSSPGAAVLQRKTGAGRSATADLKAARRVMPTPEAFQSLETGTPAKEMLAKLGQPAFRVVASEEGRLVEIYQYSLKGRDLGSVRVVDGKVTEVLPAGQ